MGRGQLNWRGGKKVTREEHQDSSPKAKQTEDGGGKITKSKFLAFPKQGKVPTQRKSG